MPNALQAISEHVERIACEDATGIKGAGDYRQVAREHGFDHLKVVDWTSSAGDWTFLVSKDGETWFPMTRTNDWPRPSFTYTVHTDESYVGTADEALEQFCDLWY